jgi:hypothetical protein
MAETREQQNPDWNQNGETQANRDRDDRQRDHERSGRAPSTLPPDDTRAEGRDQPPANAGRDRNSPWMGGG